METFVPHPRDRHDVPICKEIEAHNWKQALRLVDKRLTRHQSFWLQALRFYIQCCSLGFIERTKASEFFLRLDTARINTYQADELELVENAVQALLQDRQISRKQDAVCQARVAAVKSNPKDEKLGLECLRACLDANELEFAMEIIPVLEKNFRDKREYSFWWIVISYMYGTSERADDDPSDDGESEERDVQKQLFLKLAIMKLEMSVKATKKLSTNYEKAPFKSFEKPQELLLLYNISRKSETHLRDSYVLDYEVGAKSKIAKGEWALQLEQLKFLSLKKDWNLLYAISHQLLKEARKNNDSGRMKDSRGADWAVWDAFLKSAKEFISQSKMLKYPSVPTDIEHKASFVITETRAEMKSHISPKSGIDKVYRRNAYLAQLEWFFVMEPRFAERIEVSYSVVELEGQFFTSHRVTRIVEFLCENSFGTSCFGDVKQYVEMLTDWERKTLLELVEPILDNPEDIFSIAIENNVKGWKSIIREKPEIQPSDVLNETRKTVQHITLELTVLKLEYLIKSSIPEFNRFGWSRKEGEDGKCNYICVLCDHQCGIFCESCLQPIANKALRLYLNYSRSNSTVDKFLLPTDRHPADGFAIIAAMALTKLAIGSKQKKPRNVDVRTTPAHSQRLLQATAILEYAHNRSKPNPDVTLLLVCLYYQLGAGSLAMETYQDLNLKQVQNQTLSYVLFDRISTLHPNPQPGGSSPRNRKINPDRDLENLQRWCPKSKKYTYDNIWKSLENGNYDTVFQLLEFNQKLSSSWTIAMSVIERRRVTRILRPDFEVKEDSHGFDLLPVKPFKGYFEHGIDIFDYNSFPNFECSKYFSFQELIAPAPNVNANRMVVYLMAERLHELAASSVKDDENNYLASLNRLRITHLEDGRGKDHLVIGFGTKDLTKPETVYMHLVSFLISFVLEMIDPIPPLEFGTIQYYLPIVEEHIGWLVSTCVEETANKFSSQWVLPLFNTVMHPLYVLQEVALLLTAVSRFLSGDSRCIFQENRSPYADFKENIETLTEELLRTCAFCAGEIRLHMWESGWLDRMLSRVKGTETGLEKGTEIGDQILQLMGEEGLESFSSTLLESWNESVEGLSSVCKRSI